MKFCRLQALKEEIGHDWDNLNLPAKVLVFLGIFLLFSVLFVALYDAGVGDFGSKIEVIFRSSLASVFGFLLSSNIKNTCKSNNKIYDTEKLKDETSITEECKSISKSKENYYYKEGNSIQVLVALVTTLVSGIFMLTIYVFNLSYDIGVLSQFRDFMCMSIGFLLGESKIKNDNN